VSYLLKTCCFISDDQGRIKAARRIYIFGGRTDANQRKAETRPVQTLCTGKRLPIAPPKRPYEEHSPNKLCKPFANRAYFSEKKKRKPLISSEKSGVYLVGAQGI
jgi:hypothetical protein